MPALVYAALSTAIVSSLGMLLVPAISHETGVSVGTEQWMLTLNLLIGAIATQVMGRLSDEPHRKRLLLSALLIILVGSIIAAVAPNFTVFLIGRALQRPDLRDRSGHDRPRPPLRRRRQGQVIHLEPVGDHGHRDWGRLPSDRNRRWTLRFPVRVLVCRLVCGDGHRCGFPSRVARPRSAGPTHAFRLHLRGPARSRTGCPASGHQ
jgi:hypothetical protein